MNRYAVIGSPVKHSLSPQIHQAFAVQTGLELSYDRITVQPGRVGDFIARFQREGGLGANVTVPLKLEAYQLASRCDSFADAAMAVNTLVFSSDGEIAGYNTDGIGLLRDLTQRHGVSLEGKQVAIIGAGGATQGVVAPLLETQLTRLLIANRTLAKAEALVERFSDPRLRAVSLSAVPTDMDLVINATSIGLQAGQMPVSPEVVAGSYCYDMSYGANARFAAWALDHGARYSWDGLGMLVEQAAESFYIWHVHRVDTDPVFATLKEAQKGSHA
jgi:shikimate dehydrogenase